MRPRRSAARRPPPPARAGFTVAEVVVTLLLLAGGALAVVAASAGAVRAVSAAEAQALAVSAARERVERLASGPCSRLRSGAAVDSARRVRERWIVGAPRNGARILTDSVEYADRGVAHHVVVQRLVLC